MTELCFVCRQDSADLCQSCRLVWFCARHKELHRRGEYCFPVRVEERIGVGRCLVATRNIKRGELVLWEPTYVTGPSREPGLVCLGCLKSLTGSTVFPCLQCRLPLCSATCPATSNHQVECRVLRLGVDPGKDGPTSHQEQEQRNETSERILHENPIRGKSVQKTGQGDEDRQDEYVDYCQRISGLVLPLRYLLLSDLLVNPSIELCEGQADIRLSGCEEVSELLLKALQANVVLRSEAPEGSLSRPVYSEGSPAVAVPRVWRLDEVSDRLLAAVNMVFTNSKSLSEVAGLERGAAIYSLYSILNHSCLPNTAFRILQDESIRVVATEQILEGDQIFTRYTAISIGQPRRSELLEYHWGFTCSCARCRDPTELGTWCSAIRCVYQSCQGYVLPYTTHIWRCSECEGPVGLDQVNSRLTRAERTMKNNLTSDTDANTLENTVAVLQSFLHPNHYLVTQVEYVLLRSYWMGGVLSRPVQDRVLQLADHLIHVLNLIEPGSVTMARVLKIMIPAWMEKAKQDLKAGSISEAEFGGRRDRCYRLVDQLIYCTRTCNPPLPADAKRTHSTRK